MDERQLQLLSQIMDTMQTLASEMTSLKQDISEVKQDVTNIKSDVSSIKLIMENQIVPNINLVAEGHGDLSRKLHDALRVESEREMFIIKLNYLEDEIRKLKSMM